MRVHKAKEYRDVCHLDLSERNLTTLKPGAWLPLLSSQLAHANLMSALFVRPALQT